DEYVKNRAAKGFTGIQAYVLRGLEVKNIKPLLLAAVDEESGKDACAPSDFQRRALMLRTIGFPICVCTLSAGLLGAAPIAVHPDNPHYYLFNGKPAILITSAEHYGGVVNKDFDYVTYFDAL